MEIKIVTHTAPHHMDEFLATGYVFNKHFNSVVTRISHDAEIPSDADYVLDIGGVYDPNRGLYDHHQDRNLNSTIGLVNPELLEIYDIFRYWDIKDRFGPNAAQREFKEVSDDTWMLLRASEELVLSVANKTSDKEFGMLAMCVYSQFVNRINSIMSFDEQVKVFNDVVKEVIINPDGCDMADILIEVYEEELVKKYTREKVLNEKIEIKVGDYTGYYIPVVKDMNGNVVSVGIKETGGDFLIVLNVRSDKASIVCDTDRCTVDDILVPLFGADIENKIRFKHASGFLAVLDYSMDEVMVMME